MISNNSAKGNIVCFSTVCFNKFHHCFKHVRLIDIVFSLHNHCDSLKTTSGIYIFLRKFSYHFSVFFFIFHKDIVPYLYDLSFLIGQKIFLMAHISETFFCHIVKHFSVWSTRPIISRAPPVIFLWEEIDTMLRNIFFPYFYSFKVSWSISISFKYSDIESTRIKSKPFFF